MALRLDLSVRDTVTTAKDTIVTGSIPEEEDTVLFGFTEDLDTVPRIMARDTMKVPDSLRVTDPFRFRYYAAIKDSLTHRIVVDSLKAVGDSLDWPVVDSLYLADSTETATRKFNEWYASLTKKERKRYDYEKALPAKLHRLDSIAAVKDSIKAIRDSIRENTPRILETFAIPDSMQYKRIITWHPDEWFGKVELQPFDTTFNLQFYDHPYYREDVNITHLGPIGSAARSFNYFKMAGSEGVGFYAPYEKYSFSPASVPLYNTKTPHTELEYHGTIFSNEEREEDNIRIFTTQNIYPSLNFTLEYKRYGSGGMLLNESTANKTFVASSNYLGKRYVAQGGYIYNKVTRTENGGLKDSYWIRDTTVNSREIDVHLLKASNHLKKNTVFFNQTYSMPFYFLETIPLRKEEKADAARLASVTASGDSLAILATQNELAIKAERRDSLRNAIHEGVGRNITTAYIGTASEYSVYHKIYEDQITDAGGREYYRNLFYINPTTSFDSLRVMKFENRAFIRLQPWSEDAIVSKIEGGVGDKLLSHHMFTPDGYLTGPKNTVWNSLYAYAGAEGRWRNNIAWDGFGRFTFGGHDAGDFFIGANATISLFPFRRARKSPVTINAHFETSLTEPEYFQQHFYSNHLQWDASFSKISETRLTGRVSVPRWNLEAEAGYALVSGQMYYDSTGVAMQAGSPVSVFSASLRKDFTFGIVHMDNRALLQFSSDQYAMPLPTLALNLKYYLQFDVRKNVMKMQLGANIFYNTAWYAPGYNPVIGQFTSQDREKYGNCPVIDAFINMQWKRASIFVKVGNAGLGWPNDRPDYFSAAGYIQPQRTFKIGISWPFYTQPYKNESVSGRASGGFSGGGSSGGRGGSSGGGGRRTGGNGNARSR